MDKLIIITRSNYEVHEFISTHGLSIDNVDIVKSMNDLINCKGKNYVVIPPGPRCYHQYMRYYLIKNKYKNITKLYNRKLINF